MRVTGLGCGGLFLIVMIAAAALNTGTNLLYLMLAGLLSFWVFSLIVGTANLRRATVTRRLPSEAHARQSTHIEYQVHNQSKRMGAFGLTLRDEIESRKGPPLSLHFLSVPAGGNSRKEAEFRPHRRGIIHFARVQLSASFPFGFLDFARTFDMPDQILVYPELIPVRPVISARAVELGMRDSKVRGHGSNLYAIRDYVPGDPARSIHWKLSAKGTGVKIRETEREESQRIRITLDFPLRRNAGAEDMERFERAVSATASLADLFLRAETELTLWTPRGTIPLGAGEYQWRQVMKSLALVEATDWMTDGESPRPPTGGGFLDIAVTPESLDDICVATQDSVA